MNVNGRIFAFMHVGSPDLETYVRRILADVIAVLSVHEWLGNTLIGTTASELEDDRPPVDKLSGWIKWQMGLPQMRVLIKNRPGRERLAKTLLGRYGSLPVFTDYVLAVMDEHGLDEIESLALALERIENPVVQPPPATEAPTALPLGPRALEKVSAVA